MKPSTINQLHWLNQYFIKSTPKNLKPAQFNKEDLSYKQAMILIQMLKNGADSKILNKIDKSTKLI